MTRVMQNTVSIVAPTLVVWAVLMDFVGRSEWDPYYREVRGEAAPGARLTVRASLRDDTERLVTSHPRIVALEAGEHLAWTNRFVLPGLLDSRNDFRLTPSSTGGTRLDQTERFAGLLVGPSEKVLDAVEARLRQWVVAIKRRVETVGPRPEDPPGR